MTNLLIIVTSVLLTSLASHAARTGSSCSSSLGPGLCTPIAECGQLPRLRLSGRSPEVCGFDGNGPKVCCPANPRTPYNDLPFEDFDQNDEPYNANTRRDDPFFSYDGNTGASGTWGREEAAPARPVPSWSSREEERRPTGGRPETFFGGPDDGFDAERGPRFPDVAPDSWNSRRPEPPVRRPAGRPGPGISNGRFDTRYESTTEEDRFLWDEPKVNKTQPKYAWKPTVKRISEIMCDEYSEMLTPPKFGNSRQGTGPSKPAHQCYQAALQLIVGGRDAEYGEFPHMAALGYLNADGKIAWDCGGTLISDEYVLTAAHCIQTTRGAPVKVRLGVVNLLANDANQADYVIGDTIVHPDYRKNKQYYDIALARIDKPVAFSKSVRPACLSNDDAIPVNKAVATGWGRLTTVGHQSTDSLQKVEVTLIDFKKCDQLFQDAVYPQLNKGISKDMICAGEEGKDTCLGDSGGPLQFVKKDNKCIYYICGVTSFGKSTCGARNSAGVYTKVSSFLQWIEGIVWPQ